MKISTKYLFKFNRLIKNNRIKFFLVFLADLLGWRYTIIRLDPTFACNLRCQVCYFSDPEWRKQNPPTVFSDHDILKISKYFFPTALQLYIGCGMEPTIYKNYTDIIKIAKTYKVPFVSLISNGQLINKFHLNKFSEYGLDELVISTHGVKPSTYERLMRGASYQHFIDLLGAIDEIKRDNNSKKPLLRLNYTITPDNLIELNDFFDMYDKFNIDTIQLRPVFDWYVNSINTEYQNHDLLPFITEYNKIVSQFKINCMKRNISLFYNLIDPTFSKVNTYAPVYNEGVIRLINPRKVWLEEFDWRNETYDQFKRRIGFRQKMLEYAVGKRKIEYQKTPSALSDVL